MADTDNSAAGMPFIISTSMDKADAEMRKLIRSRCMLGKNRGRILHGRRKPKTVVPASEPVQTLLDLEAASAVPKMLGSELSLLRFADSIEPSTLWEVLKFTSSAKQIFFPLERCFDFAHDRSMFDPLTFDAVYLNGIVFGAQAYLDLASGRSSRRSSVQMLKTIQLLRGRLSILDGNDQTFISNPTILIVLTLAHIAHLTGDHAAAERHFEGLCKMVNLRGGIAAFQNSPSFLTELLRCDISIAIHKGTNPVFDFAHHVQPIIYQPQTSSSSPSTPCLDDNSPDGNDQYPNIITDENLAKQWATLSNFCCLVNSVADKHIKLSEHILSNTMGTVMYALLRMSFPTSPINEAIRLGLLAFCSHSFLERRGIRLPNGYLHENYRTCLEDVDTLSRGASQAALWLLMIGKISLYAADADDSAWINSRLAEQIRLNKDCSWPQLRLILKSFLWIDILHDKPGKLIFESVS